MFIKTSQKLIILSSLFFLLLPLMAQDSSSTPEATAELTESFYLVFTASPSPTSTAVLDVTATSLPSLSPTPSAEITETSTSAESTEVNNPSPEATAVTTAFPEITELPVNLEATAEITEIISVSTTSPVSIATATQIADRVMRGRVLYQIGENHSGISIHAWNEEGWSSTAVSDEQGIYNLELISASSFEIEFSAALYLSQSIRLVPGDSAPIITLRGGDLNANACVGSLDLELLLSQYGKSDTPDTDLNFDTVTDVVDFVILTGNMQADCEQMPNSTATVDGNEANSASTPTETWETATEDSSLFPTETGVPTMP